MNILQYMIDSPVDKHIGQLFVIANNSAIRSSSSSTHQRALNAIFCDISVYLQINLILQKLQKFSPIRL